jgi:hypothetical protein
VWTGAGSAQKMRTKRWNSAKGGSYSATATESLRCIALGRQVNPRILLWACEHHLTLAEVPQLRCSCGNKLCVLPAHMHPIGPRPAVTAAPAITPEILQLLAEMSEDEILARLKGPFLEPLPEDLFDEPA